MRETIPYRDRTEAGRVLAGALRGYAGRDDVVVLALPRGGVPVAYEVAMELGAPLDLMLVRKLGFPGREELASGAVASGGVRVLNPETAGYLSPEEIERITGRELAELARRQRRYRGDRPLPELGGRTVILIDDGLATGSTMRAAVAALRQLGPESIVVAVPVAPPSTIAELRPVVDDIVCPQTPELFFAIGQWYLDFAQTSDEEVVELLQRAAEAVKARSGDSPGDGPTHGHAAAGTAAGLMGAVSLVAAGVTLPGELTIPGGAVGVVAFAHGSGSSRHSPRNRYVAEVLGGAGLGTLLFDLLTSEEERIDRVTRQVRFDIDLLARRLVGAVEWLATQAASRGLGIGLFGASTGAAAALIAAAERPDDVRAVVSRGGRPDLAMNALARVRSPTLLIVGAHDREVLALNRAAAAELVFAENRVEVIPGATHLFEEPGTLEAVARLAAEWFVRHLQSRSPAP